MNSDKKSPNSGPRRGFSMHADDATLRSLISVTPLEWEARLAGSGGEIWTAEIDGGDARYVITLDGSVREPFMVSRSTALTPFAQKATLASAQKAADEDNRRRVLANLRGVLPCDLEQLQDMLAGWQRFNKASQVLNTGRRKVDTVQEAALLKAMARDLKTAIGPSFKRLNVDLKAASEPKVDVEAQIRMLFPI